MTGSGHYYAVFNKQEIEERHGFMNNRNDIDLLPGIFASLEEDRVLEIIDRYLSVNGDALRIVAGLSQGMEAVGQLYKNEEYALAELVYAGEIFKEAMKRVKPRLVEGDDTHHGECIMGTVEGDIHDLGKNIVSTLLECSGFRVIDLGVDVPPARFVEAVRDSRARLVGMSLLLTTAIDAVGTTINALTEAGFRDRIAIMIGGAPASERLRSEIGADFYGRDAIEALAIARRVYNDAT